MMRPKRLLSAVLAATMAASVFTFAVPAASATTPTFDENNIVLRFPALSDIHITSTTGVAADHFNSAMDQLNAYGKLDALLVSGDYTDYGLESQVQALSTLMSKKLDPTKTRLVMAPGNHEFYQHDKDDAAMPEGETAPFKVPEYLIKHLGADKIYQGATKDEIAAGNYKTVVNGYTMIALNCWTYSGGVKFRAEDIAWFKEALKDVDPNKPFFVSMHPVIKGTNLGEGYGAYWATTDDELYNIMKDYPNAVVFSGHLHFPVHDERIIWQGDFTAVGSGSVYYASLEEADKDGNKYWGISGSSPSDAMNISNGMMVEVDKNNNTRITRIDFMNKEVIKQPWVIGAPKSDKSQLETYDTEARTAANKAPAFASGAKVSAKKVDDPKITAMDITLTAATDDDMVHSYELTFLTGTDNPTPIKKMLLYSDFYKQAKPSQMAKELTYRLDDKSLYPMKPDYFADYKVQVVPIDSWGAKGAPIVSEVYKGSGGAGDDAVIDETVEKDWQFKLYTNFNSYKEGYLLKQNSDFNSWPTPDMEGAPQHQPMASNGFVNSIALTTELNSTDTYFDVLFSVGGNGYKTDFIGGKEFWVWVDFSEVELEDLYFGYRVENSYGTEYLTKNLADDKMVAYIQNDDGTWDPYPFANGKMNIGGYKGFIRFDASYFYNEYSVYPADLQAFVIGYKAKDENSIGKSLVIDQIGFAGPQVDKADGTVEKLLNGEQFSGFVPSDQAPMTETKYTTLLDFNNEVFEANRNLSDKEYAGSKYITSPDRELGAYFEMQVVPYPTASNAINQAMKLQNLDGTFKGEHNTKGLYTEINVKPRASAGSTRQFLPEGQSIDNNSRDSGILFYVDTTKYNAGVFDMQLMFHEQDYKEDGTPNATLDEEGKEEPVMTHRGVAVGGEYYVENNGTFVLGGQSLNTYINLPSDYKGYIKIPFASFEEQWSASIDSNGKIDMQNVDYLAFYYGCYPDRTGEIIFDDFAFYGPAFGSDSEEESSEPSTEESSVSGTPSTSDGSNITGPSDSSNNTGVTDNNPPAGSEQSSTGSSVTAPNTGSAGIGGMLSGLVVAGLSLGAALLIGQNRRKK